MPQKPPWRSTQIIGSQLNFPLQMMMHFVISCTFPRMLLLWSTTGCKCGTQLLPVLHMGPFSNFTSSTKCTLNAFYVWMCSSSHNESHLWCNYSRAASDPAPEAQWICWSLSFRIWWFPSCSGFSPQASPCRVPAHRDIKFSAQGTAITSGVREPLVRPDFTCLGSTWSLIPCWWQNFFLCFSGYK